MSESELSHPRVSRSPGALALWGTLLVSYTLSTGPVAWLMQEGYLDSESRVLEAIYFPVGWLMQHSEVVCEAMFVYLAVWGVRIS